MAPRTSAAAVPSTPAAAPAGPGIAGDESHPPQPPRHLTTERAREAEDDLALINRVRAGDHSAFRTLVERYQRRAWRIAVTMVKDETDAQEIVQEAFVRVFRNISSFEGKSSFFTWLYRIIHNIAFDLIARNRRWHIVGDESALDDDPNRDATRVFLAHGDLGDPDAVLDRAELRARLVAALDALPPAQRAALLMKEIEGMTHQEIAQAQGVPMGTVMSRLFNARVKLKKSLTRSSKGRARAKAQSSAPAASSRSASSNEGLGFSLSAFLGPQLVGA